MDIMFIRGAENTYTVTVRRGDGVSLLLPGNGRNFRLPHDAAHCIVERELGLRRGFWGRVADGAIYPNMQVLSGRQPPHAAERSRLVRREAEPQGVEAEVLVGLLFTIMSRNRENDAPAVEALLRRAWRPRRPERPPPEMNEVRRACAALREAERQWLALEAGQALRLIWPQDRRRKRHAA